MTPEPAPIVHKVRSDAMIEPARPKLVAEVVRDVQTKARIEAKAEADITDADRREWWHAWGRLILAQLRDATPIEICARMMSEIAGISISQTKLRKRLEQRVSALEAQAKPRVRVPAGRRVV